MPRAIAIHNDKIRSDLLTQKKHLYIIGVFFILHNLEEVIGFIYFSMPASASSFFQELSPFQIAMSVGIITLFVWLIIAWMQNLQSPVIFRNMLTIFAAVFLFNAFFPHILGAFLLKRYFPALLTSVFLYLPYSVWMLTVISKSYSSTGRFFKVVAFGIAVALLVTFITQSISYILFKLQI